MLPPDLDYLSKDGLLERPGLAGELRRSLFAAHEDRNCMVISLAHCGVRASAAGRIAAVEHVDGTARVQTVEESASPRLAALLEEFLRITGVPAILNTSFNDREPIVETPAHALATFQDTGLDALCIGDYLAEKA